jgi:hypothetical protein
VCRSGVVWGRWRRMRRLGGLLFFVVLARNRDQNHSKILNPVFGMKLPDEALLFWVETVRFGIMI